MDPCSSHDDGEPKPGITALVSEFFERRHAGEELTLERFAAEHPESAAELRLHLAGLPLIDKACTSIGDAVAGEAPLASGDLASIEGYDLLEEIGRGGMGVVYKALQISTKRIVALKVMLAGPFASPSGRRRFEREAELAARLRHPNIVSVLEGGRVAEQPYYAMDYVSGVRLDLYLAAGQLDLRTTLSLFVQVCEAVEYAHAHGVIHRDLKPANVLIDEEGNPHILDFGLAKATDQVDSTEILTACVSLPGQVLGTLSYLSPEQAAGAPEEIDARTDVHALGVMLFEALTGSLPFNMTGRPSWVIQRILETPPTRPSSLSDRVDSELETIILKALEKEKARRYHSAREMADDIRRYLEGEPILARRPSSLYFLRKKLRKHRLAVAVGTAVVVLVLAGLLYGSWSKQCQLADARRTAVELQRALETVPASRTLGPARALFAQHPELPEARLVWAQAQYRNEKTRHEAIGFLEGGLQHVPSGWACRALLAEIYRAAGDGERADALQAPAVREAPDTAEAWYLASFATLELETALRCAQQAVQCQPAHALAWCRLTWLRHQTGDLTGALQGAEKLIELGDSPAEWTLFKGQVLHMQGRFRQAIEQYTRATVARLKEASVYVYRAHAYRRLKEYPKAVADYTKALELEGEATANIWYRYQRATPLWILGRADEALADYERVRLVLGRPWYSEARRFLILCELSRQREAEEVLAAALRDVQAGALRDVEAAWLRQILRCLAGQLTPDELVADGVARNNREQLCEAYYYAGEVCLLASNRDEARKWFELCVQTGVHFDPDAALGIPMNEYELAQWRLDTLFSDQSPTSQP